MRRSGDQNSILSTNFTTNAVADVVKTYSGRLDALIARSAAENDSFVCVENDRDRLEFPIIHSRLSCWEIK